MRLLAHIAYYDAATRIDDRRGTISKASPKKRHRTYLGVCAIIREIDRVHDFDAKDIVVDCNKDNAFIGEWPGIKGYLMANGFSGHGLQQGPAVGRYLSELMLGLTPELDLSVFSPQRILENRPIREDAWAIK